MGPRATSTPSRAAVKEQQAGRMKRMQLILKKALDVSVHGASMVQLRTCLEEACQDDAELHAAFFPPPTAARSEHQDPEELAAQAVLSLRQKIETVFQWLCDSHDVNAELLELEDLIQRAEEARLRKAEAAGTDAATPPPQPQQRNSDDSEDEEDAQPEDVSPEALIRAERLRAKRQEARELEELVAQLEARNHELQRSVDATRRSAEAAVQRMQRAAAQLNEASHLAKNYASCP